MFKYYLEMAAASAIHKEKTYYHGTSTQKSIDGILQHGIIPPDLSNIKGALRPIDGKVYLTQSLKYAVMYVIGGDMAGNKLPNNWIERDPFGYLCIIDGNSLVDIQPDEDSVGQIAGDLIRINKKLEPYNEEYKFDVKDLKWLSDLINRKLTQNQCQKIEDGEYEYYAKVGKKLLPFMRDEEKLQLINAGAHIAHEGKIIPSQIWKFDKTKCEQLEKDCSNFFKLAERIK